MMDTEPPTDRRTSFSRGRKWSIGFHVLLSSLALLAVIVAVTNFVVDVLAALIDPRVRY